MQRPLCPARIPWKGGVGGNRAAQRCPHSPDRTTLNGRYAPQVWPGTVGLGGPVLVTPGGLFPLAFRTSVLSPAGTARTLLARPSSPGSCRSNPSRRERQRAHACVSVAARPAGKCRRRSSGRMPGVSLRLGVVVLRSEWSSELVGVEARGLGEHLEMRLLSYF